MGIMDNMKDKMEGMSRDRMMQRFDELRAKDQSGNLDDSGREELARLRERLNM